MKIHLSRKGIAGVVLIALALVTLAAVPLWTARAGAIDFPCEDGAVPFPARPFPPEQRRITYCISAYPRNVQTGGGVYAIGRSNRDEVVLEARHPEYGDLVLQRDGATLVVNGQRLQKKERFTALRYFPSSNPWLLLTADWRIVNGGLYQNPTVAGSTPTETLGVGGDVVEGWAPSPLGAVILVAGVALVLLNVRERVRRKNQPSVS